MSNLPKQTIDRDINPLVELSNVLSEDMKSVNALILDYMQSDVPMIPQLAGHLITAGGKRVRPLLTLACAALFDYQGQRQYKLAACVEFIHTATLLHDDVVDESDQRRGQVTANTLFGNEASVLVGDFLFSRAFQLMVSDGCLEVLRILSTASAVIAEGEVMQLTTANNLKTSKEEYIKVIEGKTAELFAAACEVGGVVADASAEQNEALRVYGHCLGIAFQITDDVLDYVADAEEMGKSVGDDFKEGKMTLPIVLAVERSDEEEKAFWQRVMGDLDQSGDDLKCAIQIMNKYNTINDSLKVANKYGEQAKDALSIVGDSHIKVLLDQLISFILERKY